MVSAIRAASMLWAALLAVGVAAGETFPVTKTEDTNDGICDEDCSLREAVDSANRSAGADAVSVPAGIYPLSLGLQIAITDDLTIAGAGQSQTIIDGGRSFRVLSVEVGAATELRDLALDRLSTPFSQGAARGIENRGDLTLRSVRVSRNRETDFLFLGSGAGVFNSGSLRLIDSAVVGNSAGSSGGGVYNGGAATAELTNSVVGGNVAEFGGGIYNAGTLTVTKSTISGNRCISDVFSGQGGGIYSRGGVVALINSTVSGNSAGPADPYATGTGGGIWNEAGTILISNSTVSGNRANFGSAGGIGNRSGAGGTITISNSIVSMNAAANCGGAVDSLGYNLADDDSCGLFGPGDLITDARLGPLADHGGATYTHALLPDSPAIDAGSAECPPPNSDQRGVARPQGAACDIGSFELEVDPIAVGIDIRPGSDSNPIHLYARSIVPVAILGSESLDVLQVDVTTLAFGPGGAAPRHDLSDPEVFDEHLSDVNDDGFLDLLSHYRVPEAGISPDDTEACLTGSLSDGAGFEGCDDIRIVRPTRKARSFSTAR